MCGEGGDEIIVMIIIRILIIAILMIAIIFNECKKDYYK